MLFYLFFIEIVVHLREYNTIVKLWKRQLENF